MRLPSAILRLFRNEAPVIAWVTSDLAVGPAPRQTAWHLIRQAGIRGVLDLRAEAPDSEEAVAAAGLEYQHLPVEDLSVPAAGELEAVVAWVIERITTGGPVLIHCREGRGRSPFVAAAVLVRLGLPLPEAYRLLQRACPDLMLSDEQVAVLESIG